ncbi:MAG: class II aldolase/adducin family protein [Thermoprotei archaeon]|jgi:L-fuculose-phosphate aldolase
MASDKREIVASCMDMLYQRGLVTATGGNVSARNSDISFYITPTSLFKGEITAETVSLLDLEGNVLEGLHKPSSEWRMHASIYRAFPEVNYIVHAHPTYALALLRSGLSFSPITEEASILLAEGVGVVEKMVPGTWEFAEAVSSSLKGRKAVLIKDHGAVTVGKDCVEAFARMDVLEQNCKIVVLWRLLQKR